MVSGDTTGQIGSWENAVGGNNKMALYSGKIETAVLLPSTAPPPGEARWADGVTEVLPLMSAETALKEMQVGNGQKCSECTALVVTAAQLSTAEVSTSRGPATIPVWEFAILGSVVRITQVAITASSSVTVSPPPWDSNNPPVGLSIDSAEGTTIGRTLTVHFTGAANGADKPCGSDYEGAPVESELAVVVIIIEHRNPWPGACDAVGYARTTTIQLMQPLGGRAVLEVTQGLPVSVTLRP